MLLIAEKTKVLAKMMSNEKEMPMISRCSSSKWLEETVNPICLSNILIIAIS